MRLKCRPQYERRIEIAATSVDLVQNPSQSASFLDSVSLSCCSVERRGDPSRGRWPVQARVGDQLADTVERRVLTAWFQRDGRTLIRPCPDGNGYYSNEERPSGESTNKRS